MSAKISGQHFLLHQRTSSGGSSSGSWTQPTPAGNSSIPNRPITAKRFNSKAQGRAAHPGLCWVEGAKLSIIGRIGQTRHPRPGSPRLFCAAGPNYPNRLQPATARPDSRQSSRLSTPQRADSRQIGSKHRQGRIAEAAKPQTARSATASCGSSRYPSQHRSQSLSTLPGSRKSRLKQSVRWSFHACRGKFQRTERWTWLSFRRTPWRAQH